MKITKSQLSNILNEEMKKILTEQSKRDIINESATQVSMLETLRDILATLRRIEEHGGL